MEFTVADIFQYSPFGDILNSLKSLSLSGEPRPNYGLRGWDSDDEEIQSPPTAHLIATVDDISNMLDFGSEDFDGMDDEGGDEQEPAPVGRWTATSSYDIYTVDAPKDGDGDGTAEDDTLKKQPKRRRQRRRSKSHHSRTVILAREIILPRIAPKNTKSSKIRRRKMEKPALMRERQSERLRMITTCLPPKTRQASTTTNSSYHQTPPNKSILNACF